MTVRTPALPRRSTEPVLVPLAADGRVADEAAFRRAGEAAARATDSFIFCHGWLYDLDEARQQGARFFALLESALHPVRQGVRPLFMTLHWPSKPFADGTGGGPGGVFDTLGRVPPKLACALLGQLCESEVPRGPEEEAELAALRRRVHHAGTLPALPISALQAMSFWMMKRRAGEVGERLGRHQLAAWPSATRLHLVGHSFGAKLAASAVLGGARPASLTLLLAAFSAFAFAPEVPGFGRPGAYHALVADRLVRRPVVVLRSDHDRALGTFYPMVSGPNGGEVPAGDQRAARARDVVAASALGAVGARGVGAPDLALTEVQRVGLPEWPVVNVNGSDIVRAREPLVGSHRDIFHPDIARLVLLAAGIVEVGPDGMQAPRLDPLARR